MIAIIILMIIAISLSGLAAYQLYAITQNQNLLIQSQKNQSTLALWKSMIISKGKAVGDNNEIVLPFGENTANYQRVPSWIYFNTKNPWGKDIIYCPLSSNYSGTYNTTVVLDKDSSYPVRTVKNFATTVNGIQRDYVVASIKTSYDENILAFLVSPIPSSTGILPKCSDISYDSDLNIFKVNNGLVEVISKGDVETFANMASVKDQNSGNGGFYTNKVEGEGSSSDNTLKNNLNYVVGQDISKAYITLSAGTHYIEDTVLNEFRTNDNDVPKVIVIEGETSNANDTVIDTNLETAKLVFNNYKVVFRNIKISDKVINNLKSSSLTLENAEISNLVLNNSTLNVQENSVIRGSKNVVKGLVSPEAHAINAYNSKIKVDSGKFLNVFETNSSAITDYAIKAVSSNLTLNGELYVNKGLTTQSDTIVLIDSVLTLNSEPTNTSLTGLVRIFGNGSTYKSDLLIDELSKTYISTNSNIVLSGKSTYGIYNYGSLTSTGGNVITEYGGVNNAAISLGSGSQLYLDSSSKDSLYNNSITIGNTTLANRPEFGIYDNGAKLISGGTGANVKVYAKTSALNCFFSTLPASVFTFSETNKNEGLFSKNSASTTDSSFLMANKSNWSCNI